jgi:xanthine dehydrogenase accessory factor
MSERVLARLARCVATSPVVLASVIATRGATPRKRGARMLITADGSESSIGGGAAEARVIAAARALLSRGDDAMRRSTRLDIALNGLPGAAGVCGGHMEVALRGWHGAEDRARAARLAAALARGEPVQLEPTDSAGEDAETVTPDARLLIVGGGHCGIALCDFARQLDFDVWLFDSRADAAAGGIPAGATCVRGDHARLSSVLDTGREVLAVLLNRDFHEDVRTLQVLALRPPVYIGMMGSARRIHEVLAALPAEREALATLQAPVGLDIGAETPHEIAISILAQILQWRAARRMA